MKVIEAPQWAADLMNEAFEYAGFKESKQRGGARIYAIPTLIWKTHDKKYTSGHAKYGYRYSRGFNGRTRIQKPQIIIRAGTDEWEHKMVLLHEVAHHLCAWNVSHSETFWRKAWALYDHFGLDHKRCLDRERKWTGSKRVHTKMFGTGTGEILS